jgi:hypothetical protein
VIITKRGMAQARMVFQLGNHQNERTNWRRFFKVRRFNAEDAEKRKATEEWRRKVAATQEGTGAAGQRQDGDVKSPLQEEERPRGRAQAGRAVGGRQSALCF